MNRSALITRRRVQDVVAVVVVASLLASACTIAGYLFGYSRRSIPAQCPSIEGLQAYSSADTKDGQFCWYMHAPFAAPAVEVRLRKRT